MSWHYLQGQEEESWEGNSLDGAPDALLKLIPTAGLSCSPDKETESLIPSPSGMMCKPLAGSDGKEMLMSSQADFHVRTYQRPEKERDSQVNVLDCGRTWPVSSVKFNPDTCWWRTHHCLLPEDLTSYWLTLPRWGSMRSGELSERTMPVRLTGGIGSGFWPTPNVCGGGNPPSGLTKKKGHWVRPSGAKAHLGLDQAVKMFPTTTSRDWKSGKASQATMDRNSRPLSEVVVSGGMKTQRTWPTPRSCTAMAAPVNANAKFPNLETVAAKRGEVGTLNPDWVEWLMGWPIGWTDLKPLETARFLVWLSLHGRS